MLFRAEFLARNDVDLPSASQLAIGHLENKRILRLSSGTTAHGSRRIHARLPAPSASSWLP